MTSVSEAADPLLPDRHNTTRRDFLKTSLVTSVAAAAVGVNAAGEQTRAMPGSKAEHPSLITVTDAAPSAPLQKPWKNAIEVDVPLLLLRERPSEPSGDIAALYRLSLLPDLRDLPGRDGRRCAPEGREPGLPLGPGGQGHLMRCSGSISALS